MSATSDALKDFTEKRLVVGSLHILGGDETANDIEILTQLEETLPFTNAHDGRDRSIAQGHRGPRMEMGTHGWHIPCSPGYGEDLSWQQFWRENYKIDDQALAIIAAASANGYTMVSFDQDVSLLPDDAMDAILERFLDKNQKRAPEDPGMGM